jgi:hypothetical protein
MTVGPTTKSEPFSSEPTATPMQSRLCVLSVSVSLPLAVRRVPHPDRLVLAPANDPFSIGAPGHARDRVRVPLERERFLSRRRLPHFECLVVASADNALSVGAECHA